MSDVQLFIIRGLPGSGKSTAAKNIIADRAFAHWEADMFFIDQEGVYKYDPNKIGEAHKWCQQKTKESLSKGISTVVSNTFVKKWEVEPYLTIAERVGGVKITILTASGNYTNTHGVPQTVVERMRKNWEWF